MKFFKSSLVLVLLVVMVCSFSISVSAEPSIDPEGTHHYSQELLDFLGVSEEELIQNLENAKPAEIVDVNKIDFIQLFASKLVYSFKDMPKQGTNKNFLVSDTRFQIQMGQPR
ncbi:hypothetical protein EJP82_06465 [Paenibacillus anaericanus]|uniref:DUF3888 domain-containing protein n=1 Tax=Paenibacillus anaericanus TaxID=170367 RepID=A0A433YBT9_9BACL|nr:hypothetical protein [Paenibacillus anaericanus]RUT47352.1 hypothetical protein EJP82_06465 [Paenibacillus anaericanus]